MNKNCIDCGKCCLETEMPLSKSDIELIIESSLGALKKEDFAIKVNEGYYQLRNINGSCFFLNTKSNRCKIYRNRPQGCRFYPLIFDYDENKCIYDKECPRNELFQLKGVEFEKTCKNLKTFINKELKISFK